GTGPLAGERPTPQRGGWRTCTCRRARAGFPAHPASPACNAMRRSGSFLEGASVQAAVAVPVAAVAGIQPEVDVRILDGVGIGPPAADFQQDGIGAAAILQVVAVRGTRGKAG